MDHLIGDASKAKAQLGWQPSVDFKGLVTMMVDADLKRYGVPGSRGPDDLVGRATCLVLPLTAAEEPEG